jgi:hypothetical protein
MEQPSLFDRAASNTAPFQGRSSEARHASKSVALPPFEGRTFQARHASYTGALHALETRQSQIDRLREAWVRPLTLNEAAEATGIPLASVCRRKAEMDAELVFVEFQTVQWAKRPTKRSRWQLATAK